MALKKSSLGCPLVVAAALAAASLLGLAGAAEAAECTPANADRFGIVAGKVSGGCCSGLTECIEKRFASDPSYCALGDPGFGRTCWDNIVMCRFHCGDTYVPSTESESTTTASTTTSIVPPLPA